MSEQTQKGQASLWQKIQVLDYHRYKITTEPKYRQSETVRHFQETGDFAISKSAFNRWVLSEDKIRADFERIGWNRSVSRRRKAGRSASEVQQFLDANSHVLQCLEKFSIQRILAGSEELRDQPLLDAFNEFKEEFQEEGSMNSVEGADVQLVGEISHRLSEQLHAVKCGLEEVQRISKHYKTLVSEKRRIADEIKEYSNEDVFYFSEIIVDLDTLYELTDTSKVLEITDSFFSNGDNDFLRGNFSCRKTVSLGFGANLNGTEYFPTLLISNLVQCNDKYNEIHYQPEGLNEIAIFESYLEQINVKMLSEGRKIKLLVDNYWPHMSSFNRFSNISIVLMNPRFDRVISEFSSSHLSLPHEFGLARLLKSKLKLVLFKMFVKHAAGQGADNYFKQNCKGIVGVIFNVVNITIDQLQNDGAYKEFYWLNILASKLLSIPEETGDGSDRYQFNIDPGTKLSNAITSSIASEFKNSIKYNEKENLLVLRDNETELKNFVNAYTKAVVWENEGRRPNKMVVSQGLIAEIVNGRNEKKLNKTYNIKGICQIVKAGNEFHDHSQQIGSQSSTRDTEIGEVLMKSVMPYMTANTQSNRGLLTTKNLSLEGDSTISENTQNLFFHFYLSYLNDTFKVTCAENTGSSQKRNIDQVNATGEQSLTLTSNSTAAGDVSSLKKQRKAPRSSQTSKIRRLLTPLGQSQNSVTRSNNIFDSEAYQTSSTSTKKYHTHTTDKNPSLKYKVSFSDDESSFDSS